MLLTVFLVVKICWGSLDYQWNVLDPFPLLQTQTHTVTGAIFQWDQPLRPTDHKSKSLRHRLNLNELL